MTKDELAKANEYQALLDKLAAAKKGKDRDKLQAAKLAVFEFRSQQRASNEPTGAQPATVTTKVKGN